MPIVERADGTTAYLETEEAAKAYAADIGGTVYADDDNPDDKRTAESPDSEDASGDGESPA